MSEPSEECGCQAQDTSIQSAVSIVQTQHYISFRALCRKIGIEAIAQRGFLENLQAECRDANSSIGELNEDEAERSLLQTNIFYSKIWAKTVQWPATVGMRIGYDLYVKILSNNWNNYGRNHEVNNECLTGAYFDHVIKWQMGFGGCHYAWKEFSRLYKGMTELDCGLGADEIITCCIPGVDAETLRGIDPSGIIRSNVIVNSGDILVGKVQIREMPRNRLLADMGDPIRDVSLRVPSGMFGMVTEVQIERRRGLAGNRDHVKRTRMIEDMIEDILSELFLGDRLGANVVDDETQKCLVPANKKITRTDIRRMVERRDSLSIEDTHVKARIETVFKEFRPYFDALSRDIASIRNVHVSLKRKEGQ